MHADDFGDLHHRQWFEGGHAFVHEFALAFYDLARNVQNRLLPLVQALDQKFSGADFFADVIANFRRILALGHQIFVSVADPQMRDVLVVSSDHVFIADSLNEHLGQDVLVIVR